MSEKETGSEKTAATDPKSVEKSDKKKALPKELGGTDGPEPTRYGDWEHKGIISDF